MEIDIREMHEHYKQMNRELDEVGGPEKDGRLFESIIVMEEDILRLFELPPAQKFRKILWGDDTVEVISRLCEASEEYANRPIRDTSLMLVDAISYVVSGAFWRGFFSYLSFNTRYEPFTLGVVDLPSAVFFVSVAALFLAFCVVALERRRWN